MLRALFPIQLQKHWFNTVFLALGIFLTKTGTGGIDYQENKVLFSYLYKFNPPRLSLLFKMATTLIYLYKRKNVQDTTIKDESGNFDSVYPPPPRHTF